MEMESVLVDFAGQDDPGMYHIRAYATGSEGTTLIGWRYVYREYQE